MFPAWNVCHQCGKSWQSCGGGLNICDECTDKVAERMRIRTEKIKQERINKDPYFQWVKEKIKENKRLKL